MCEAGVVNLALEYPFYADTYARDEWALTTARGGVVETRQLPLPAKCLGRVTNSMSHMIRL